MTACTEVAPVLAAHVFQALDPGEHLAVDGHLAECSACREAYSRLGGLPVLLDLAGSAEGAIRPPPPLLEASVLAALPQPPRHAASRRPRPRGLIGVAAAVAGLALCVTLLGPLFAGPLDRRLRVRLTATAPASAASAVARLAARAWGTQVDLDAVGLPPTSGPQIYEVWFVSGRGRLSAGTFTVSGGGSASIRFAAAGRAADYTSLGVTLEPDGLAPAIRGREVLHALLPA